MCLEGMRRVSFDDDISKGKRYHHWSRSWHDLMKSVPQAAHLEASLHTRVHTRIDLQIRSVLCTGKTATGVQLRAPAEPMASLHLGFTASSTKGRVGEC